MILIWSMNQFLYENQCRLHGLHDGVKKIGGQNVSEELLYYMSYNLIMSVLRHNKETTLVKSL